MEVFLIALFMLGLAFLGIAVKLLFDKRKDINSQSCGTSLNEDNDMICGCGTGACGLNIDKSVMPKSRKADAFDLQ